MPQATTFTLTDREATPVVHTFIPNGETKAGEWVFTETGPTKVGENRVHISTRKVGGNYKVRFLIVMPVVGIEVINGVSTPKVLRTAYSELNLTFSELSTLQERRNIMAFLAFAVPETQTMLNAVFSKLEMLY